MSKPRNSKAHSGPQQVRIIAGEWRGRSLSVVQKESVRPTPNRIRETLFNWLQAYIPGSVCLDLFAGSGALGFEAASRGAERVTILEIERDIVALLEQQARVFNAHNIEILKADGFEYPAHTQQNFDIIFLDPPFVCKEIGDLIKKITDASILKPAGMIYVERPLGELPEELPSGYVWRKRSKASQVEFGLIASH